MITRSPFTFIEYIEFSSADEFKKFKRMKPVTNADIQDCDWDTLFKKFERDCVVSKRR